MPVNVELQPLARLDLLQEVREISRLRGVERSRPLVGIIARIGGCTTGSRPLDIPVPVDVAADALASGVGLAVLAPETLVGLRVDEAVWIDRRKDVEIVLVEEPLDLGVRVVIGHEVICDILVDHGRDPLPRMDGAVEDDGGLDTFARAAPEMDARDGPSVEGIPRADNG